MQQKTPGDRQKVYNTPVFSKRMIRKQNNKIYGFSLKGNVEAFLKSCFFGPLLSLQFRFRKTVKGKIPWQRKKS
jgi:hypothetical protein